MFTIPAARFQAHPLMGSVNRVLGFHEDVVGLTLSGDLQTHRSRYCPMH
jgi:hypothetical protein